MRVLFWGTPEFAAAPLRALIGEGFEVVGVVTRPDRPVGRSRSKLAAPVVKQIALEEGLPVLQPERPRGEEFLSQLRELEPDLSVVVAYGHILSTDVIDLPTRGTINIHASLLPKLRGAAPIQAAILEGHTETGVTIMRMVRALDAGPSILQARTPIADDETYGELQLRLAELGALALVEAMALITFEKAEETPQNDAEATYAAKVDRTRTRIHWSEDAAAIGRAIRAYDPRPGAYATSATGEVKLFGARAAGAERVGEPGEVVGIDASGMIVACGTGTVQITNVHPSGKKRITPLEWARGRGVAVGERLS